MNRPIKRRKQEKPDSAGLDWANAEGLRSEEYGLSILGTSSTIFEGGPDQELMVMPWPVDPEATMDRFDARMLLGSIPIPLLTTGVGEDKNVPGSSNSEELDTERYADLDQSREAELSHAAGWFAPSTAQEDDGSLPRNEERGSPFSPEDGPGEVNLAAVGFSYSSEYGIEAEPDTLDQKPSTPFHAPFKIPDGIQTPLTMQMHKIIMQTAKFVRGAGKQSVFILRVKHGSNPKMAFLMPNHELHPYFQWAVDNDLVEDASELDVAGGSAGITDAGITRQDGGGSGTALGLLSTYSSDTPKSEEQSTPLSDKPDGIHCDSSALLESHLSANAQENHPQEVAAESPPAQYARLSPETEAVMDKLVAFVKKNGAKFEASIRRREKDNPLFAFLQPESQDHSAYRAKLAAAIGVDEAQAVLPMLSEVKPSISLSLNTKPPTPRKRVMVALPEGHGQAPDASTNRDQGGAVPLKSANSIRPNPALIRVAIHPQTKAKAIGLQAAPSHANDMAQDEAAHLEHRTEDTRPSASGAVAGEAQVLAAPPNGKEPKHARALEDPVGLNEELLGTDKPYSRADAKATDEGKKAQRRELAKQLLKAKLAPTKLERTVASKIIDHRSAFLAEDDDMDPDPLPPPEAGEILANADQSLTLEAVKPLPGLEELLKAKQKTSQPLFSECEVLSPSTSVRASKPGRSRSRKTHRNNKERSRESSSASSSSDQSSSSDSSASRERHRRKGRTKSCKHRRRTARKDSDLDLSDDSDRHRRRGSSRKTAWRDRRERHTREMKSHKHSRT